MNFFFLSFKSMCKLDIAYIIYPSYNITGQEVNHFTKTRLVSKTRLPPIENPTPGSLVRYTSYDPTQGDRIKVMYPASPLSTSSNTVETTSLYYYKDEPPL